MLHRSPLSCWLLLLCLGWLLMAAAPPSGKLKKISFGTGMSASIPAEFQLMPDEAIATKYPAPRRPLTAWTSASGQVDFVASEKATPFQPGDLNILLNFFKANVLQIYGGKVEFLQQKVVKLGKQDFIALEFNSTLSEGATAKQAPLRRYFYLLYTVLPKASEKEQPRLLTFTFTAPGVLAPDWQPLARKVMATVKVK